MLSRPSNHQRSHSAGKRSRSPARFLTKMRSANALSDFNRSGRRLSPAGLEDLQESDFNTLRDPRMASTSDLTGTSDSSHHPDLSSEVATLSAKLVQAINNQTSLDDSLSATRQELEAAQERLLELESENEKYRTDIASGVMVKRSDIEAEILSMKNALDEERAKRSVAEKEKREMEQELETLTAALFEEANKMVAAAKQEREAVEKKNEQLRAQIKDTEALVASQEEQLAELKTVMQEMQSTRDENDTTPNPSTAPTSPAVAMQTVGRFLDASNTAPGTPVLPEIIPAPSTSFTHLIKPVYRTDMVAYEDFRELLDFANASKPPSRVPSGSYGGLNVMGLAGLTSSSSSNSTSGSPGNNQSHTPAGSPQTAVPHTPLKDTRFYKRVLVEDFEPTLRLDSAPSISWLTRRSVFSSLCDGTLIVEPMPASHRKYQFPCGLCGERRLGDVNERTHRFRTSESESAQRYSLCVLCLEKVRACCEFAGYLRMILDGHVHVADVEEEKEAWEETIRLRERIFWSRFGGGVVPSFAPTEYSEKALLVPVPAAEIEAKIDESASEAKSPLDSTADMADEGLEKTPPALPPRNGEHVADSLESDVKETLTVDTVVQADEKVENVEDISNDTDDNEAGEQLRTDLETTPPDASHSTENSEPLSPKTESTTPHTNNHDLENIPSGDAKAMPGAFN
ncbi:GDP/GTP exchange factor Sec2p, putative [Talaromyces stipitatus ATCC 10500]|uniref:GDP/GTP exchange factor Sec2p, putative n=1 Tax=Talaromyces stipitatus (strain ATCC 10500 / CBS 375.48 / QM 6759 / NRRL 1006) TaxID=441959 RepID=B8MLN4_TALSN|nr:GDP/GTP exchange factor Sec2p, putative [Talaromyces stipitatus ATCC 10500]EED13897.1 GDP/GTP exchange factor Sec2p, putative [Talaromyces stipitatus ATCC 10500]